MNTDPALPAHLDLRVSCCPSTLIIPSTMSCWPIDNRILPPPLLPSSQARPV